MKNYSKPTLIILVLLIFIILLSQYSHVISQSLIVNSGAVYTGNGTLKIKGGALENSSGTITGIGSDAASRISGTVEWAKSQPGQQQNVQGLYYTNLKLSGGNKLLTDGIHIYGSYLTTGHALGRTYQNTFHYDFDNPTGSSQTITTEPYNSLSLINLGRKTISSGTITLADKFTHSGGQLTINAGTGLELGSSAESQSAAAILNYGFLQTGNNSVATLNITASGSLINGGGLGAGNFNIRSGNLVAHGAITQENSQSIFVIKNGGNLYTDENGAISINDGLFQMDGGSSISAEKAINNASVFRMFSGAVLNMNNANFTNTGTISVGGSLNLTQSAAFLISGGSLTGNYSGSNGNMNLGGGLAISLTGALYLGAGDIMAVGGLFSRTADQVVDLNNNSNFSYISAVQQNILPNSGNFPKYGNLAFSGTGLKNVPNNAGNLNVMGNLNVSGSDVQLNNNEIVVNGNANYADNAEVIGKFTREAAYLNTTSTFTFNNSYSQLRFAGAVPARFTLNVQPMSSQNYSQPNITGFNSQVDVERKITTQFQLSAATQVSYLRLGYKSNEVAALLANEDELRFIKGYGTARGEKLTMSGIAKQNSTSGAFRWVALDNSNGSGTNITLVENGTGATTLASGNDIVITKGEYPVFSRRDGRWTDPGTWDDGRLPRDVDIAAIQHLVYTGIDQPVYGITPYSEDEPNGNTEAAARLIRIIPAAGAKGSALLIGNKDATIGSIRLFKTELSGAETGIIIENTALSTETEANIENFVLTGGRIINGLWVLGLTSNNYLPLLGASNITNNGQFNNNGSVEIGE